MSAMSATESKKYEKFLQSASKEKLIKILNNYQQQIVEHKDELSAIHYEDQDYSTDYDHGCDLFQPGDKIYCQRFGRSPKFVGTAMDHNKLTREQLFEVVWEA